MYLATVKRFTLATLKRLIANVIPHQKRVDSEILSTQKRKTQAYPSSFVVVVFLFSKSYIIYRCRI
jgi:hypothetical protein